MKLILSLLTALLCTTLSAQEYSREQMVQILSQQEARVDVLTDEFFTLNESIETLVQDVIDTLSALADSQETKTRVVNLKSKVLDDLKTSIRDLQQRRNANAAMMARLPANRLEGDAANRANEFLDEKISTRVDQVMEMSSSLYQSQQVRKYDYVVEERFDDDFNISRRVSDEYKQNRKQSINTNQAREQLIKDIEAAETRITQEINHIKAEQQSTGGVPLTEAQAKALQDKEDLLSTLKEKKREVYQGKTVETKEVGTTKGAMELERQVGLAMDRLRTQNAQLRQKGQELQQALMRLDAQQAKLAEYDAKQAN